MRIHKNKEWDARNEVTDVREASLQVLQDIRDELKSLNQLLHCHNFINIPRKLDRISANTAKPRKKAK